MLYKTILSRHFCATFHLKSLNLFEILPYRWQTSFIHSVGHRHFEEWSYYIPILPISEVSRDMLQFRKNTNDIKQVDTVLDNSRKKHIPYILYQKNTSSTNS